MTTVSPEAAAVLANWAETAAPAWYATRPETGYVRGVGVLPEVGDLSTGLVAALLASLKIRAVYRIHDDALIALRPDPADGVLSVYPRARLLDILRTVLGALPTLPPSEDDEFPEAVARLRRTLPEAYLREVLDDALDRRVTDDPIDEETEAVRLTPAPTRTRRRRSSSALQREHLDVFLASVPLGVHRTKDVFDEYTKAAVRSGARPLGRSAFYSAADLELGPRVRWARGEVYRVTAPEIDPSDFAAVDVLGFTPAALTPQVREILARALRRRAN